MSTSATTTLEETLTRRADLEHTGFIDYVCWLSDDIVLLSGWFHLPTDARVEACFIQGSKVIPLELRCHSYPIPPVPGDTSGDPALGKVMTARLLKPWDLEGGSFGRLVIRCGTSTFSPRPFDISTVVDLPILLQSRLTLLDWQGPASMRQFLTTTLHAHLGTRNLLRLSQSVAIINDALRERHESFPVTPEHARNVWVDQIFGINESSFYLRGWVSDPSAKLEQLCLISPEGGLTDITQNTFYYFRSDLEHFFNTPPSPRGTPVHGLLSYFTTDSPSVVPNGWIARMKNSAGEVLETHLFPVISDHATIKDQLLNDLAAHSTDGRLLCNHIIPALTQLQHERHQQISIDRIEQYGVPPEQPEVSIIIPLYKRVDFLEQQLAQFVSDPEIHRADLIYVLDSPELAETLPYLASQLFELYQVPFRLVILNENFGYAGANNAGATVARARLLLLLNSDVLPDEPGWLGDLVSFYDSTPNIGALGPKLLFEDDTLQHAGLFFERWDDGPLWLNKHYYKGFHRDFPEANIAREVPAVTGACMMIDTSLFRELGGLRGTYIQGDFEDSDFCLRLIALGYKNWYVPTVELYHLEGQSYTIPMRQLTMKFNASVHTQIWGELIAEVMSRYPGRFQTIIDNRSMAPPFFTTSAQSKTLCEGAPTSFTAQTRIIRTSRSDLIDLYLQNCTWHSEDKNDTDQPIWIMSESGSVIRHSPALPALEG